MLPLMPPTFPEEIFREFRKSVGGLFPNVRQVDNSPERDQFVLSTLAAGHRYRTCVECNEEFRTLVITAPEIWREWNLDPEHAYRVERCLYTFFMNGVSVFETLAFSLYFVGGAVRPGDFPLIHKPRGINLKSTSETFDAAFPHEPITGHLAALPQCSEFRALDSARNLLAHRVSGMRSVRGNSTRELDGSYTSTKEEVWYVPGQDALIFDEDLLQRQLDGITSMLTTLLSASRDFVIRRKP
jgi:hypothetical protein